MPESVAGLQIIDWLRLTHRSLAEWALRDPPRHQVVMVLESSSCRRHPERYSLPHA